LREEEFFFRQLRYVGLFEQAVAIENRFWLPDEVPEEAAAGPEDVDRLPEAILNPTRTQRMSTIAKATNAIIIEFTDQRFCITPP